MKRKILVLPNTNTLSHFTRALACTEWLENEGFETHIGISQSRRFWASKYHPRCHKLLELWEPSSVPFPCLQWFSNKEYIEECVRSQEQLIATVKPDLIIGIFDYIASITSGSIPYISINGACMLPIFMGVLGFDECESAERVEQKRIFNAFWSFGARAFEQTFKNRNLPFVERLDKLLTGDLNLIYETESVCGMSELPAPYKFAGPLLWEGWEDIGEKAPWERNGQLTIYFNTGTLMKNERIMKGVVQECLKTGARLLVSSGMDGPIETKENLYCKPFLSPQSAASIADLVVCTGGVGVCYTNLLHAVPSLVLPMQPEQATNGLNLKRAGCGDVLNYNTLYVGNSSQYENAFNAEQFGTVLKKMLSKKDQSQKLAHVSSEVKSYQTKENIVNAVRTFL